MPALTPEDPELATRLSDPATTLVACLCADWCGTCRDYRPAFESLAARLPDDHILVWLDIEDDADYLDGVDDDVEQFPTLFIEKQGVVSFFGPMLPHISQLEDLLLRLREGRYQASTQGPALRASLLGGN